MHGVAAIAATELARTLAMALTTPLDSFARPSDLPLRSEPLPKCLPFHRFPVKSDLLHHRQQLSLRPPFWVRASPSRAHPPFPGDEGNDEEEEEQEEVEEQQHGSIPHGREQQDIDQALHLDGAIPATSDGFLKQVSSRAYDMRRQFEQSVDTTSYDVLEANPWREDPKPVYVLAQEENKLLTMRTRRERSEVENELNLLFPKRGSRRGTKGLPRSSSLDQPSKSTATSNGTRFRMVVEDVREGVLVFEDEDEATRYCNLLDGQGKGCMGVAELDASDVFALCQKSKALAVLFRRGKTPPLPERLQLNLKARKRSLED